MAELEADGDELVLHLHTVEKAEGFHGDIRLPLSAVTAIRAVDDPWPELRGIRAPGTGVPEVIAVGTRRGDFGKDFAAVHGRGPAVVVELAGADYGRLVVTCDDACRGGHPTSGRRAHGPPAGQELTAGGALAPPAGTQAPAGPDRGQGHEGSRLIGGNDGVAVEVEGRLRQLPSISSPGRHGETAPPGTPRTHSELFARKTTIRRDDLRVARQPLADCRASVTGPATSARIQCGFLFQRPLGSPGAQRQRQRRPASAVLSRSGSGVDPGDGTKTTARCRAG